MGWALWACTCTWQRIKNQLIHDTKAHTGRGEPISVPDNTKVKAHTKSLVSSSLALPAGLLEPRCLTVRRRPAVVGRRRRSSRLPKGNHGILSGGDLCSQTRSARSSAPAAPELRGTSTFRSVPSLPSFFYCPGIGASGSSCWNLSCKSVSCRLTRSA